MFLIVLWCQHILFPTIWFIINMDSLKLRCFIQPSYIVWITNLWTYKIEYFLKDKRWTNFGMFLKIYCARLSFVVFLSRICSTFWFPMFWIFTESCSKAFFLLEFVVGIVCTQRLISDHCFKETVSVLEAVVWLGLSSRCQHLEFNRQTSIIFWVDIWVELLWVDGSVFFQPESHSAWLSSGLNGCWTSLPCVWLGSNNDWATLCFYIWSGPKKLMF